MNYRLIKCKCEIYSTYYLKYRIQAIFVGPKLKAVTAINHNVNPNLLLWNEKYRSVHVYRNYCLETNADDGIFIRSQIISRITKKQEYNVRASKTNLSSF